MLVLTRRPGESVTIDLMKHIDPRTPVAALFTGGPIKLVVIAVRGTQVRLGISADTGMRILREELLVEDLPGKSQAGLHSVTGVRSAQST